MIFRAGNLSCAEAGGILYIHTSHTMYKSSDGKNHQSNMMAQIREGDMTVAGTTLGTYVSHSFQQFVMVDSLGNLILANHGDGYPRAMRLTKLDNKAGKEDILPMGGEETYSYVETDPFPGLTGDNQTNANLGGIAETSNGYLMAYRQRASSAIGDLYQVKLAYIAKKDFQSVVYATGGEPNNHFQIRQLTDTKADLMNWDPNTAPNQGNPYLVSTGLSGGYVVWQSSRKEVSWAKYDADGKTGAIQTAPGRLSDCQPIFFNGKVIWYAAEQTDVEKFTLTFYTLDSSGLTAVDAAAPPAPKKPVLPSNPSDLFKDVAADHWALDYIRTCVEKGVVNGVGNGMFNPEGEVTYKEFIVMLTRACYAEDVSRITDTEGKPWYYPNMVVAQDSYLMESTDMRRYGGYPEPVVADNTINRYEMASVLYGAANSYNKPSAGGDWRDARNSIKDYDLFSGENNMGNYFLTVPVCYQMGVLTGMEDGCFHGERTMTRAQACAVIVRMMDVIGDPPAGGTHQIAVVYLNAVTGDQVGNFGFIREIPEGEAYSFTCQVIPGYTTDRPVISGVMGRSNRYVKVYYTPN